MIIEFEKIETVVNKNFKGGEKEIAVRMFDDGNNKIMKGILIPGASIGLHAHVGTSEIIVIEHGKGKILADGEYERVEEGSVHYCPEGHEHSLINDSDEDLCYFAVVPTHKIVK